MSSQHSSRPERAAGHLLNRFLGHYVGFFVVGDIGDALMEEVRRWELLRITDDHGLVAWVYGDRQRHRRVGADQEHFAVTQVWQERHG
ncbi:hypothetical protein ACQZ5M_18480 [Rhizobium sp. 22-785-1]